MGNSLHKNSSAASAENNEPTPAIVALTEADVEIIKRTWKIPSANVGLFMLATNWIFIMLHAHEKKVVCEQKRERETKRFSIMRFKLNYLNISARLLSHE